MSRETSIFAPAKINLYLHVTGRREDGLHLLDSLVVFANDVADIVTIEEADLFSFDVTGPFASSVGEDNIVVKAARAYGDIPVKITLEKNIPVGAGIGGGSSDAGVTVRGLEELYGPMKNRDAAMLALGADVPVCYRAAPCRFEGIGEIISNVPVLPAFHMLLIWPGKATATKDVFARREKTFRDVPVLLPEAFATLNHFIQFLKQQGNDLSDAAEAITHEIGDARKFLEVQDGCLLARMSGSGSCVFGIFEDRALCEKVRRDAGAAHPAWWVQTTSFNSV